MLDMTTMYKTYMALTKRYKRLAAQIEQVDQRIKHCDRLEKEFYQDYRKSLVDRLEGLYMAMDIVFRAINQKEFY